MTQETLECVEITTGPDPKHAIIWMHGLGADANDFVPIVPELPIQGAPSIRFVFPNAPIQPVTINNGMAMRSWYDISTADLVRREDENGIRQSEQAIKALVARENIRGIPTENIVLAGFSQGCAMAIHTGLRLNEKLAGIVCLSGYLPLLDKVADESSSANQSTRIFMAHGTMDPVVPIERAKESYKWLTNNGYQVTWQEYPMPHSVCMEEVTDIGAFLVEVLKA